MIESADELKGFGPTAEAPRLATEARSVGRTAVSYELISILVLLNTVIAVICWRGRWRFGNGTWLAKVAGSNHYDLTPSGIQEWAQSRRGMLLGLRQDQDLLLAEPEWIPTLLEVLGDPATIPAKRTIIVSALLQMVVDHLRGDDDEYCLLPSAVAAIREGLLEHVEYSRAAESQLGSNSSMVLCAILGDPFPGDVPSWIRDSCSHL